jgi:hypothetical protein
MKTSPRDEPVLLRRLEQAYCAEVGSEFRSRDVAVVTKTRNYSVTKQSDLSQASETPWIHLYFCYNLVLVCIKACAQAEVYTSMHGGAVHMRNTPSW